MSSILSEAYAECDDVEKVCKAAQYNKLMCNYLRKVITLSAEPAVKLLQRQTYSQENNVSTENINRFKNSLVRIKKFVESITQIYIPIKYEDATNIKNDFYQIMEEYWTCVKDLNNLSTMFSICFKEDEIEDFIKIQSLVKNNLFSHGLIISDRGIAPTNKSGARYKIIIEPHSTKNFYVNLVPIKTQSDTLLKYNIKPSAISFQDLQIISSQLSNEFSNNVYLEIRFPLWELIFRKEDIIIPEKLIGGIKNALKCNNPYQELMQIFKDHGHFVPGKVILGHKLYRMSCLEKNKTLSVKKRIVTCEDFEKIEFKELWDQWYNSIVHFNFNESYLLSTYSEMFKREDLKGWAESCPKENIYDVQIISWDKLYPLYELLDDNLEQKVKAVLGIENITIKEKVLMSGAIPITDSLYYFVKFPCKLNNENYRIFGRLVAQDGKPINAIIKFKALTPHGFVMLICIDETVRSKYSNLKVFWIMVGLPEIGFYSPNSRDIPILASGSYKFAYAKDFDIAVLLPDNLPTNWIFYISFQYHNCGPSFSATIYYSKVNNKIKIKIYDSSKIHSSKYDQSKEEYLLHWCILPKGHEILVDVLKSQRVLIDVLPQNLESLANILENQEILTDLSRDNPSETRFNLNSIGQGEYNLKSQNHDDQCWPF
ncbi:10118_t:CDS:2 [Dentiscutata erythropus]|uniref:10118_t:CDS:1 n=1 Tax=Dentiscutata erythropus TaxID=1348616 RepID=A0A9N8VFR1_9GLOM|nr:10118_t:CDS:2 [Dentiscutata erythropus]